MANYDNDKAWELLNKAEQSVREFVDYVGLDYDIDEEEYITTNIPEFVEDLDRDYADSLLIIGG